MRLIEVTRKQYQELKRLMDEMGNTPLIAKGEIESYGDEIKAKWDAQAVTFWLTE